MSQFSNLRIKNINKMLSCYEWIIKNIILNVILRRLRIRAIVVPLKVFMNVTGPMPLKDDYFFLFSIFYSKVILR